MNQHLFDLILDCLEPPTLACMVRDLEDSLDDWQHYPELAPPDPLKQEVARLIEALTTLGAKLTEGAEPDFQQLIEQTREQQRLEEEWLVRRDQQERQNWLQDYQ